MTGGNIEILNGKPNPKPKLMLLTFKIFFAIAPFGLIPIAARVKMHDAGMMLAEELMTDLL